MASSRKKMTWRGELKSRIATEFDVGEDFDIDDIYEWEEHFQRMYPGNRHIKATLRDLIQQFRDEGLVKFNDWEGSYKLLEDPRADDT